MVPARRAVARANGNSPQFRRKRGLDCAPVLSPTTSPNGCCEFNQFDIVDMFITEPAGDRDAPVSLFFAGVLGIQTANVVADAIAEAVGVDDGDEHQPDGVDQDVTLAPVDLLGSVVAARTAAFRGLHRPAVDHRGGRSWRTAFPLARSAVKGMVDAAPPPSGQ